MIIRVPPISGADRALELQAALAAVGPGGTVELEPGEYRIHRGPAAPSIVVDSRTLNLRGATLRMFGSGIRPGDRAAADWVLVQLQGDRPEILSGNMDASTRFETSEQTHLIQVRGPSAGARIEGISFTMPTIGVHQGGDAIRLLGEWDRWVLGTLIKGCTGIVCDRSFIGIQRGVQGLLVEDSQCLQAGDQAFDCEATGTDAFGSVPCIRDVVVRNCTFRGAEAASQAVTVGGRGKSVATDILFDGVTVRGGGFDVLDAGQMMLRNVDVDVERGEASVIQARRRIGCLRLVDSTFRAGAGTGEAVLKVTALHGERPRRIVSVGSTFMTDRLIPAVKLEGCDSAVFVGSRLRYAGDDESSGEYAITGRLGSRCYLFDTKIERFGATADVDGEFLSRSW